MKIENGYKKDLSYNELMNLKNIKEISKDEEYELQALYEIRCKYNKYKIEAFKNENEIKDCELGAVFDDLNKKQLCELNKLRKEIGKKLITWDNI